MHRDRTVTDEVRSDSTLSREAKDQHKVTTSGRCIMGRELQALQFTATVVF